jgi:hypothetical protein
LLSTESALKLKSKLKALNASQLADIQPSLVEIQTTFSPEQIQENATSLESSQMARESFWTDLGIDSEEAIQTKLALQNHITKSGRTKDQLAETFSRVQHKPDSMDSDTIAKLVIFTYKVSFVRTLGLSLSLVKFLKFLNYCL